LIHDKTNLPKGGCEVKFQPHYFSNIKAFCLKSSLINNEVIMTTDNVDQTRAKLLVEQDFLIKNE